MAAGVEGKVLAWPKGADKSGVSAAAASVFLVQNLISTPWEDMGPHLLEVMRDERCFFWVVVLEGWMALGFLFGFIDWDIDWWAGSLRFLFRLVGGLVGGLIG